LLIFFNRKYLLNVANTVAPNSVVNAVNDIRNERLQHKIE